MTIRKALIELMAALQPLYGDAEAMSIADLVAEHITGVARNKRLSSRDEMITSEQENRFNILQAELLTHKPVQYVLGEAWFMDLKFSVNENVLIPRPETEELADLVIKFSKNKELKIVDIGTGSGCIPVSLKKNLPSCEIYAVDISKEALQVAAQNAHAHDVEIHFKGLNILDESQWSQLPSVDIIVSNPPYIPLSGKSSMHNNVLNFEPHLALFVPDNDPLIFYKKIVEFAERKLASNVYFEIHQDHGVQLLQCFAGTNFKTSLKKDINGHDRFLLLEK